MLPHMPHSSRSTPGEVVGYPAALSSSAVCLANESCHARLRRVGIVGAGLMGTAIAAAYANKTSRWSSPIAIRRPARRPAIGSSRNWPSTATFPANESPRPWKNA